MSTFLCQPPLNSGSSLHCSLRGGSDKHLNKYEGDHRLSLDVQDRETGLFVGVGWTKVFGTHDPNTGTGVLVSILPSRNQTQTQN